MPDWLKQIDSEKDKDLFGDQISTEDAEEISALPEDNLPEWLKDLKEEEFGERSAIDALLSEDEEQEEVVSEENVISEAEITGGEKTSIQPALETEIAEDETEAGDDETPDWMQALRGIADDVPSSEESDEIKPDIQTESEQIKIEDEEPQFGLEEETEEVEKQEEPDVMVAVEQEEIDESVEEEIAEHEIAQVESSDWVPEIDIDETSDTYKKAEEPIIHEISTPVAKPPVLEPGLAELLEEARRSLQDGDMDATSTIFKKLIRKGKNIPDVIKILKEGLEAHPIDVSLWQLLGDALMRDDKLSDAMEAYTNAEELIR